MRWTGYPYFAYYAAKAAVNQATVALAIQYARQSIRANCIMPGLIDTPLIYKQISSEYGSVEDMVTARNAAVPLGRMGTAWDSRIRLSSLLLTRHSSSRVFVSRSMAARVVQSHRLHEAERLLAACTDLLASGSKGMRHGFVRRLE